ncbi:thiamine phosphate synthase [Haliangium ochraceum]|uniref:Thiamine-phosphate synthase n=1 Tax=Haliangium ochraceum (strain DSM 14365 / JCM 11303 / SMP-2) TaxID=502025 RepID=D0LFM2_HALO1|nr:thiamine phosphate synthase [Haliangium ochraceum]ACY12656.1 thiamine-phosphate pyrophosphorylase [Haliangium ochraceum DSM 14365]
MRWQQRLTGFYSILDSDDEQLARLLVRPVEQGGAGATVMQVRVKPPEPVSVAELLKVARMARSVTARAGALLVVDDHIDVALSVDADGVHLGQDDLPLVEARALVERWRPERPFLIGVSTHNRAQVEAAVRGGADYLGFGPVYATSSKRNPDPVQGIPGLQEAVQAAGATPIVAIGGITPERAEQVAAAGAAAACCISAVNRDAEPAQAGARIGAAWTPLRQPPR